MDWLNTELSGEKLLSFYLEASDISSTDQHKFIVDFNITFFFPDPSQNSCYIRQDSSQSLVSNKTFRWEVWILNVNVLYNLFFHSNIHSSVSRTFVSITYR